MPHGAMRGTKMEHDHGAGLGVTAKKPVFDIKNKVFGVKNKVFDSHAQTGGNRSRNPKSGSLNGEAEF